MKYDVIIVGAGLAGISCARALHHENTSFLLIDKSGSLGGKLRTDCMNGYLLDRGFQVFFTAYPECKHELDYDSLNLHSFYPGSLVRINDKFYKIADPWRKPLDLISTIRAPVGSLKDKLKIGLLKSSLKNKSLNNIFDGSDIRTSQHLENLGFSDQIISAFFKPLLSGVFGDNDLVTSSIMFEFIFSMMSSGQTTLPERGIQAIPAQMAESLPQKSILLNTSVTEVSDKSVITCCGDQIHADTVIVATDGPSAETLLNVPSPSYKSSTCIYFSSEKSPDINNCLALNGTGYGPINSLCVPSNVSTSYAPHGKSLISITILNNKYDNELYMMSDVLTQAREWFGSEIDNWEHLNSYTIRHVLPDQSPPFSKIKNKTIYLDNGVLACGDYRQNGSINGAISSGKIAAKSALDKLKSL